MEYLLKVLAVFGLGAVELWTAVPAGLALELHPLATAVVSGAGALSGVLVVVALGERARARLLRWRGHSAGATGGRLYRFWVRYGVAGLGLLAPLVTGAPLGAALGVALGAPRRPLLFWTAAGVAVWSALLTTAAALGLAGIEALME